MAQNREIPEAHYVFSARASGELLTKVEVGTFLNCGYEYLDVTANEIVQLVASHFCQTMVQVANSAMIVDEGDPARKRFKQALRRNRVVSEKPHRSHFHPPRCSDELSYSTPLPRGTIVLFNFLFAVQLPLPAPPA